MASAVKLLATQMEATETSFLSILFEAVNKFADLTESKLFFMVESSDGVRKVGGHNELKMAYEMGRLLPQNNDIVIDDKAEEATLDTESYADRCSWASRKRKGSFSERQMDLPVKHRREEIKDPRASTVKVEEGEEEGGDGGRAGYDEDMLEFDYTDNGDEKTLSLKCKKKGLKLDDPELVNGKKSKRKLDLANGERSSVCPNSGSTSSSQLVASSSSKFMDALRQLSPAVSRKTIPRILEAYFTIKTLGDDGRVEANCKTCNKVIKGNITSTSNFRSHLQRTHRDVFDDYNRTSESSSQSRFQKHGPIRGLRDEFAAVEFASEDFAAMNSPFSDSRTEEFS